MGSSGNMKSFYRQTKKNAGISKRTPKAKASPKPTTTNPVSNHPSAANLSFDLPHNGLEKEEEALKQFDLNTAFGPCIGMSRLARWERARRLGLSPPPELHSLLQAPSVASQCLFDGRV